MFILKRKRSRLVFLLVLAVILAATTYGFAAANTFADTTDELVGEGNTTISGYEVSNIVWTLNSSNPTAFQQVEFDLDGAAAEVYAGIGAGGSVEWATCTFTSPTATCDLSALATTVQQADAFHVAAHE
jgi:hypothetical protein